MGSETPSSPSARRFVRTLFGIGIVALTLRAIHVAALQGSSLAAVPVGDGWQYDAWAQRIAAGDWLGTDTFYQAPLYPYVLGGIYWAVGHSLMAVRVLQALLGAASCVLLGYAGRHFFGERTGLVAAGLLAIYPWAIFADGLIQKSSLDLFLMTAMLASLAAFARHPRWTWLAVAGLATGAFALNRETARVLYPIVVVWLLASFRSSHTRATRLAWTAIFTVAMAAVLLPVGIRNAIVGDEFLLSTSQMGPNFYIGNHQGASGVYEPLAPGGGTPERERDDAFRLAEAATGRTLSPVEVSDYWMRQSFEFIRQHPLEWLTLTGRKFLLTINASDVADSESLEVYAEHSFVLRALSWFGFGLLVPMTAFGLWQTRADWQRLTLLYATFAAFLAGVVAFFVLARYRYPLVPIALLFSAAGLVSLTAFDRTRVSASLRAWAPGLALAVAVAIIAHLPLTRGMADTTMFNVGMGHLKMDRPAEALSWFRKAVERSPDDAAAYLAMSDAHTRLGESTQALDALRTAVRLQPEDGQAQGALALAMQAAGRLHAAIPHFMEAVRLRPDDATAHKNFGVALAQLGESARAIDEFQAALRLRPDDPSTLSDMAVLLHKDGRTAEAIAALRSAAALDPSNAYVHMNLAMMLDDAGQPAEAVAHAQEAIRRQPADLSLRYMLAELYAEMKRPQDALRTLQEALVQARSMSAHDDAAKLELLLRHFQRR